MEKYHPTSRVIPLKMKNRVWFIPPASDCYKQRNVRGKAVSLAPGMRVVVEIKTGNRRVIEFFLSPLIRHWQESLDER